MQEHDLRKIPNSFSDLNFPVSALVASRKQLASNLACGVSLLFKESGQVLHSGGQKNALGNRGQFQSIPNDDKWSQAMTRNRLTQLFALLLMAAMTTTVLAFPPPDGKGGGKGGGDEEPPPPPEVELPPIEYVPTVLPSFADSVLMTANDLNDQGLVCGYYENTLGERRAWLYDGVNTLDLNDLQPEGLADEWIINSAVGLNNNGLVVGYLSPFGDQTLRRGFVLDLVTNIIYEVPDEGFNNPYGYARKVNDNGDVLLTLDNTPYLYNPGLRAGEAYPIEFISNDFALHANLSNSLPGVAAEVVGFVGNGTSGMIYRYTQGVGYEAWTIGDASLPVDVNSFGDVAATTYVNEEIQVRKNKTETVTKTYLYRETNGVDSYNEIPSGQIEGFNDAGTAVVSAGNRTYFLDSDEWGLLDLELLLAPNSGFSTLDMSSVHGLNNSGPQGFGQVTGRIDSGEIVILSPVEVAP